MKEIPTSKGNVAKVSDEWFEYLSQWKWYDSRGYAARSAGGRKNKHMIYMHSIICPAPDGFETDHIDRDRLNNQIENLRVCTRAENTRNKSISERNTSGYAGVSWCKDRQKWLAYIFINGKSKYLGRFEDVIEAAKKRDEYSKKHYGEYAVLNFP